MHKIQPSWNKHANLKVKSQIKVKIYSSNKSPTNQVFSKIPFKKNSHDFNILYKKNIKPKPNIVNGNYETPWKQTRLTMQVAVLNGNQNNRSKTPKQHWSKYLIDCGNNTKKVFTRTLQKPRSTTLIHVPSISWKNISDNYKNNSFNLIPNYMKNNNPLNDSQKQRKDLHIILSLKRQIAAQNDIIAKKDNELLLYKQSTLNTKTNESKIENEVLIEEMNKLQAIINNKSQDELIKLMPNISRWNEENCKLLTNLNRCISVENDMKTQLFNEQENTHKIENLMTSTEADLESKWNEIKKMQERIEALTTKNNEFESQLQQANERITNLHSVILEKEATWFKNKAEIERWINKNNEYKSTYHKYEQLINYYTNTNNMFISNDNLVNVRFMLSLWFKHFNLNEEDLINLFKVNEKDILAIAENLARWFRVNNVQVIETYLLYLTRDNGEFNWKILPEKLKKDISMDYIEEEIDKEFDYGIILHVFPKIIGSDIDGKGIVDIKTLRKIITDYSRTSGGDTEAIMKSFVEESWRVNNENIDYSNWSMFDIYYTGFNLTENIVLTNEKHNWNQKQKKFILYDPETFSIEDSNFEIKGTYEMSDTTKHSKKVQNNEESTIKEKQQINVNDVKDDIKDIFTGDEMNNHVTITVGNKDCLEKINENEKKEKNTNNEDQIEKQGHDNNKGNDRDIIQDEGIEIQAEGNEMKVNDEQKTENNKDDDKEAEKKEEDIKKSEKPFDDINHNANVVNLNEDIIPFEAKGVNSDDIENENKKENTFSKEQQWSKSNKEPNQDIFDNEQSLIPKEIKDLTQQRNNTPAWNSVGLPWNEIEDQDEPAQENNGVITNFQLTQTTEYHEEENKWKPENNRDDSITQPYQENVNVFEENGQSSMNINEGNNEEKGEKNILVANKNSEIIPECTKDSSNKWNEIPGNDIITSEFVSGLFTVVCNRKKTLDNYKHNKFLYQDISAGYKDNINNNNEIRKVLDQCGVDILNENNNIVNQEWKMDYEKVHEDKDLNHKAEENSINKEKTQSLRRISNPNNIKETKILIDEDNNVNTINKNNNNHPENLHALYILTNQELHTQSRMTDKVHENKTEDLKDNDSNTKTGKDINTKKSNMESDEFDLSHEAENKNNGVELLR